MTTTPATTTTKTAPSITIHAVGVPAPQGSKNAFYNPKIGRALIVDKNPKQLRTWRQDVTAATLNLLSGDYIHINGAGTIRGKDLQVPFAGPVRVDVIFHMPRPKAHYRTGKHAGDLKPAAPVWCDKRPDTDKCLRSVCDALKDAGVYRDDSQVVQLYGEMRYADAATGAQITITPLEQPC